VDIQTRVIASIVVLVGLICLAMVLRRFGLIKEEQGPLFAGLVTHVTLPSLIFVSLAKSVLHWEYALLALIMLAAEIACLALAWLVGRRMRLAPPQLGTVVLVAGFGSSSLLGYALISQVYGGDIQAIAEAVVISELGVGPALFILGTMIALYFGSGRDDAGGRMAEALRFFRSPIFFSVVAGLLWSTLKLPTAGPYVDVPFQAMELLGSANTFLVALTVGVLLHFQGLRSLLALVAVVCAIKLILKPVMVWLPSLALGMTATQTQILVLEAAMPSALLTVVLASTYGCDARLASKLVFATSLASAVTVVTMFRLLG
jgi:predicted permease